VTSSPFLSEETFTCIRFSSSTNLHLKFQRKLKIRRNA